MPHPEHQPQDSRFQIVQPEGTAVLEYRISGHYMQIHRTYVPDSLRGQGLAAQLAEAAFDFAREKHLRVEPLCSYIRRYAERHPEAKELI
ncbi:GNAT family N-acetyltransferase [Coraliomargarita parva]|uniref:GNAT family N-acetyltransferase n=1 Tax=Coraliomargarita parva TaxID=3014050 RepID=UPI0022B5C7B3|nr:GNAT family N-acetyltransferase [Coraliomargarita parva]